jgi:hypothetical protein
MFGYSISKIMRLSQLSDASSLKPMTAKSATTASTRGGIMVTWLLCSFGSSPSCSESEDSVDREESGETVGAGKEYAAGRDIDWKEPLEVLR